MGGLFRFVLVMTRRRFEPRLGSWMGLGGWGAASVEDDDDDDNDNNDDFLE